MIEKEQQAKRVYHRTKPASKSKVRAIRFDLDLVEFVNLQPNVSRFINDLIRREKEKIERMKAIGKSSVSCPLKPSDSAPLC